MRVVAVLVLLALCGRAIAVGWGVAAFPLASIAYWLIKTDRSGQSIDNFLAWCFGLGVLGGVMDILAS